MECFKCRAHLGPEETCPKCGSNVKMYKKLLAASNYFYNKGLERAKVRDLSGAIDALKTSLQYHKANIMARNLLGLIYYEMGETVSALSEWVISKNHRDKDNIADSYLNDVQNNPSLLNTINQTIKKYNQALTYCQQGSTDLAVIQLKKILSTNPKLVKAHQLLALLYICDKKYDLAKKSLRAAEQIDRGNTITMRYLSEANAYVDPKESKAWKRKRESTVEYHNGTETIIQPTNLRDNSGWMMILNILVGLLIGVTATYFLIVPSIRQNLQRKANLEVSQANDTIASKNQMIQDLEAQVAKLEGNVQSAKTDSRKSKAQLESYNELLKAFQSYRQGEEETARKALADIDVNGLGAEAKSVYEAIQSDIHTKFLKETYDDGYDKYMSRNYTAAAETLKEVVDVDDTYNNGHAVYYLAQSYRMLQRYAEAAELYQKVIDEYPTSYLAANSKGYMQDVQTHLGDNGTTQ